MTLRLPLLLAWLTVGAAARAGSAPEFALHDGDRVVFYGDSITADGGYTRVVQEYARTRFPGLHLRFYNAGVGGDTVAGGYAGPIAVRLKRDLLALHPTVVTIMLGMNDGAYRASDPVIRHNYATGYRAIVDEILKQDPGVRLYLILPSPFDDIAWTPQFNPGYDHVLRELGQEVSAIAAEHHLATIDFGMPLNDGISRVMAKDPALARMLLPDRVHPSTAGHWVLGAALLRAWHAPTLVSAVELNAQGPAVVTSQQARVSELKSGNGGLAWTELEQALPLPVNFDDANIGLAQLAGAGLDELAQEVVKVTGLAPGRYLLHIDDRDIATFSAEELAHGVNLGRYNTPMRGQAFSVLWSTEGGQSMQLVRRGLLAHGDSTAAVAATAKELAVLEEADQDQRSVGAQPKPHQYTLTPAR